MGNEQVKVDPKGTSFLLITKQSSFIEEMRNNKRMIEKAVRKIERERKKVEAQEAKHMKEI
jgi:isochorismate hydrolase